MNEFAEAFNKLMNENDTQMEQNLDNLYSIIAKLEEENRMLREKVDRLSLLLIKKMDI